MAHSSSGSIRLQALLLLVLGMAGANGAEPIRCVLITRSDCPDCKEALASMALATQSYAEVLVFDQADETIGAYAQQREADPRVRERIIQDLSTTKPPAIALYFTENSPPVIRAWAGINP